MARSVKIIVLALVCLFAILSSVSCMQKMPEDFIEWKKENFTLDILSTGNSDCLLLRIDGVVVLIDTADEDDYGLISSYLEWYDIEKIDYLILTHYDNDHVGSAAALIRSYDVERIWGPDYQRDSSAMEALHAALTRRGLELEKLTSDKTIETENGSFTVNVPGEKYYVNDENDENNESLIITVHHGNHSLLLLGDALKERLSEFNELYPGETYDFAKLPHHGDWTKALGILLEDRDVALAVSCVGMAEEVEEKLRKKCEEADIYLYDSCDGNWHISPEGGVLTISGSSVS